jgi:hypothetical protein
MRLALLALLLAGCATATEVVPAGGGTFMVGSSGVIGNGSSAEQVVEALKAANRYCEAQGRSVEQVQTQTTAPGFGRAPAATVQFRCVPRA